MRITFVLPFYTTRPIGGLRVVYELANGLVKRGHSITIVHPRTLEGMALPNSLRARVARALDRLYTLKGVTWMHVERGVQLTHTANVTDATIPAGDVIFATNWHTAAPVLRLAEDKGRKYYLVQDFYPYLAPREVLESSWRSGFRIVCVSTWLTEMVIAAGIRESNVATVSNGVSSVHSCSVPLPARNISIVMMYGNASYKAAEDGLRAINRARNEFGEVPVRLFGPNFSRRPKALPDWAEYYPRLSEQGVSRLYNQSAIFVSSSLAEGFCLPAAEAMASGCAVVATDCGGIRDFAVDGANALLSEPGKPDQLAVNLLRVLRDGGLRERLAIEGLATMRNHTWDSAVVNLEALLALNRSTGETEVSHVASAS